VSRDTDIDEETWVSCHFYYHEDLNLLALNLLVPLVASQLRERLIDRFFFIRYRLGGPHLRLRLRVLPGFRERAVERARQAAAELMARVPSLKSLPEEDIRRTNEWLLASDAHETDDTVYPDNSFFVTSFRPETQRYGGPELLDESLDFFAISSWAALDFLARHGKRPRAAQLAAMFRMLLQQAIGLAENEEELLNLLGYAIAAWGEQFPGALNKAGDVFLAQGDVFRSLVRSEVESALASPGDGAEEDMPGPLLLGHASRRLSQAIGRPDGEGRSSVCVSQLHMTANRLGLSNAEEVYLGCLLRTVLEEIVRGDGEERARLRSLLQGSLEARIAGGAPRDLLSTIHSRLMAA